MVIKHKAFTFYFSESGRLGGVAEQLIGTSGRHHEGSSLFLLLGRIRARPKFENFEFRPFELALFC